VASAVVAVLSVVAATEVRGASGCVALSKAKTAPAPPKSRARDRMIGEAGFMATRCADPP
jgi:hypothetical protein